MWFSHGEIMIHCMSCQWPTPKESFSVDSVTQEQVGFSKHQRHHTLIENIESLIELSFNNPSKAQPNVQVW